MTNKTNGNGKIKTTKEAATKKIDGFLSNVAGKALSGIVVTLRPKDGATKETYSKVAKRFAGIRSGEELKKEIGYLTGILKEASPTITGFVGELATLRSKVAKRLINDAQSKQN